MNKPIFFDHIEIHVENVQEYCDFLITIFRGGRYKIISKSGTAMYKSNDGYNFEIKKKQLNNLPGPAGFCNPCLRMENAKDFIETELGFTITETVKNPDGNCYFFIDHEHITWHIKEYLLEDKFINW